MEMTVSDFSQLGKRVTLVGRLDIPGAGKIDAPPEIADSKTNIVVDMSGVDFIASLGTRSLVIAAKTLARNSRILVLLNPTPLVADAKSADSLTGPWSKLRNAVAIAEEGRDGDVRYLGEIDTAEAATRKLVVKFTVSSLLRPTSHSLTPAASITAKFTPSTPGAPALARASS
jgi:anti-sigma B factor antagonist